MPIKLSVSDLLIKARWQATTQTPYLAKAIWACTWIPCEEVPTAGIDKNFRIYYNPEYIERCAKDDTLIGEVLHEVLHPLKRNPSREDALAKRLGHCEHRLWNCACDAENDQNIEAIGRISLVKDRILPHMLGGQPGMTAEELYALAKENKKSKPDPRCSGGSGTGGKPAPWEVKASSEAEAKGKIGLSEAQVSLLQSQVAQDILKQEAKKPRSVPAGLSRWAKEVIEGPPVPWEDAVPGAIAYQVDKRRGSVASYDRPSRRTEEGSFVFPIHRSPAPKITVVADTSDSMGERDLGKALGVVADGCLTLGKLTVVACDSAPQTPVEVASLPELEEFFKGGGGTDMPAGIRAAEELTSPDLIVVVTDGYTDWPEEASSVPVIAVLTQSGAKGNVPEWIEVIEAYDAES